MDSVDFIRQIISSNREDFIHYFDEHMVLYNVLYFLMNIHDNISISVTNNDPILYDIKSSRGAFSNEELFDIRDRLNYLSNLTLYNRKFNIIVEYSTDDIQIKIISVDGV